MISATRESVPNISLASSSSVIRRSFSSFFFRRADKESFDFLGGVEVVIFTCSYYSRTASQVKT